MRGVQALRSVYRSFDCIIVPSADQDLLQLFLDQLFIMALLENHTNTPIQKTLKKERKEKFVKRMQEITSNLHSNNYLVWGNCMRHSLCRLYIQTSWELCSWIAILYIFIFFQIFYTKHSIPRNCHLFSSFTNDHNSCNHNDSFLNKKT